MMSHKRSKDSVFKAYIQQLAARGDLELTEEFRNQIKTHFDRLPTRYALDVSLDSLDVLSHKRLLDEARADPSAVSFAVRPVEIVVPRHRDADLSSPSPRGTNSASAVPQATKRPETAAPSSKGLLAKPAFGSSPNLQALAIEVGESHGPSTPGGHSLSGRDFAEHMSFWEITVASADQPKLLSRLSEALSDLGLNIREAHAFNTNDGFSLDVFVVDQFEPQIDANLEEMLGERLSQLPPPPTPAVKGTYPAPGQLRLPKEPLVQPMNLQGYERPGSPGGADDWEIDITQLQIDAKIASGAFSNLYRGNYCGQEVAVKILKDVQDDTSQYQEFLQEVSIMRKVRHKNVVQFIGACTRKPNLCIVFEFMSGGSVYDCIRREGTLPLVQILKIATEVARGMDYLHQRKIIHRDLKAANLLLDEHEVVKIADFGVARIIETTGHMTAETGTYRWMAPEVIEHKPYTEMADVFSFAIVLWELLTCRVPYNEMTPLQAAVGVVQKGLRPGIPSNAPPALGLLMEACWEQEAALRPSFRDLTPRLQFMLEAARDEESRRQAVAAAIPQQPKLTASGGGLLSKFRGK